MDRAYRQQHRCFGFQCLLPERDRGSPAPETRADTLSGIPVWDVPSPPACCHSTWAPAPQGYHVISATTVQMLRTCHWYQPPWLGACIPTPKHLQPNSRHLRARKASYSGKDASFDSTPIHSYPLISIGSRITDDLLDPSLANSQRQKHHKYTSPCFFTLNFLQYFPVLLLTSL